MKVKESRCHMCDSLCTRKAGEKQNYRFLFCENCYFTFCPEIIPEFLTEFYATGKNGPEDGAPKKGWCGNESFLYPALKDFPEGENLKMLDFGTGQSTIPQQLREQGHEVIAVDVAEPIEPHGDGLTGDILELDLPEDHYDFIFSFQVFEHLPQPKPVLERLVQLLRPGGELLIHTDMETSERMDNSFGDWWYVLPPDHCSYYRPRTFEVYAEQRPLHLTFKDEKRVVMKKEE